MVFSHYTIGIDYGTESGRAILVDVLDGQEIASYVVPYKHGVMNDSLPNGKKLEQDWSLQHPQDYLDVLYEAVPKVINKANIDSKNVIGLGIAFTSCTLLPLDQEGMPLCFNEELASNAHSWPKLWKHHAAQTEAEYMTKTAMKRKEPWLANYGNKISSEWTFPKILQIVNEDPQIYYCTHSFLEGADWITSLLAGYFHRSSSTTGFKALWSRKNGYPSNDYFSELNINLDGIIETKFKEEIIPVGESVGKIDKNMAKLLGLPPTVDISPGIIDAHAAVPAVGAVFANQIVITMGTSTCHMFNSDIHQPFSGVCGIVQDGIIPGVVNYETGQPAVGDIFNWYTEMLTHFTSESTLTQKDSLFAIHENLENEAKKVKPGESGLLALDWWNGNRSVLVNANLSGVIVGLTLKTQPAEIYRALLESTAFGTKKILDSFSEAGHKIEQIFISGGLPHRNYLLLQIYADVIGKEIIVDYSSQPSAFGSAIFGAVAAGEENHGYNSLSQACYAMSRSKKQTIQPNYKNSKKYEFIYKEYLKLHDYFGYIENNNTIKNLKNFM